MLMRVTQPVSTDRSWGPHPCSNCGRPIPFRRSATDTGGICAVVSFGCAECGIWMTHSTNTHSREV